MLCKTWDQNVPCPFLPLRRSKRRLNRSAGACRFNRSSLIMSSASIVPVEKSGPDFHRLAAPTRPKSTIRSIPKYGSANVVLDYGRSRTFGGIDYRDLYLNGGHAPSHGGFPAGSVANHFFYRNAYWPPHEVIHTHSGLPTPPSAPLPRP